MHEITSPFLLAGSGFILHGTVAFLLLWCEEGRIFLQHSYSIILFLRTLFLNLYRPQLSRYSFDIRLIWVSLVGASLTAGPGTISALGASSGQCGQLTPCCSTMQLVAPYFLILLSSIVWNRYPFFKRLGLVGWKLCNLKEPKLLQYQLYRWPWQLVFNVHAIFYVYIVYGSLRAGCVCRHFCLHGAGLAEAFLVAALPHRAWKQQR